MSTPEEKREMADILLRVAERIGDTVSWSAACKAGAAALLREAESDGGWLPIESAPKDGTEVLLHDADYSNTWVGAFNRYHPEWDCESGLPTLPTHWQPLPVPPTAAKKEDEK